MKRHVCMALGVPVFYDDAQGIELPTGAKRITEKQFQDFVKTRDASIFSEPRKKKTPSKGKKGRS